MSNTYTINFKQLQQEGFSELFASLEKAFEATGIDFYIVGAVARDTWFAQKGIRTIGTRDVDFAVYIPEKEKFFVLKKYLEEKEGFRNSTQNQYVMFSPSDLQVDLLPFGEIEVEGKVMIPGSGLAQIAVNGFREIYKAALVPVEFEGKRTFKVCTLPGIVILKLIAYDDRPEHRQKDIKDIGKILQHYFDLESDLIYEHHADLFDSDSETPLIAARVLGRQMKNILAHSENLKKRVVSIIETAISEKDKHQMVSLLRPDEDTTTEFIASLLSEILNGINDE
jgi:predicted nucleotidyltransferase